MAVVMGIGEMLTAGFFQLPFAIGAAVVSGLASIPVWVAPTPAQWALLIGTGVVSALAQVLMTEGYRRGEATLLAPFEYSAIIWTTLMGVLVLSVRMYSGRA